MFNHLTAFSRQLILSSCCSSKTAVVVAARKVKRQLVFVFMQISPNFVHKYSVLHHYYVHDVESKSKLLQNGGRCSAYPLIRFNLHLRSNLCNKYIGDLLKLKFSVADDRNLYISIKHAHFNQCEFVNLSILDTYFSFLLNLAVQKSYSNRSHCNSNFVQWF